MVGKRIVNRSNLAVKESIYLRRDLEEGRPQQDRKYRFRDQGHLGPDDQRRVEFKRKLLEAVGGSDLGGTERVMMRYTTAAVPTTRTHLKHSS